eukprot:6477478-Amphidinium_carterae.2
MSNSAACRYPHLLASICTSATFCCATASTPLKRHTCTDTSPLPGIRSHVHTKLGVALSFPTACCESRLDVIRKDANTVLFPFSLLTRIARRYKLPTQN